MAGRRTALLTGLLCFALLSSQALCSVHDDAALVESKETEKKEAASETTEAPPESTTSAPQEMLRPADIFRGLSRLLVKQLENQSFQWVNALVAMAFGLVMIMNGEFVFKYIVVGCIAVFVFLLSMSFLKVHFEDRFPGVVLQVVAIEIAVAIAFAAHKGYDGILVSIGLLIGALFYYYLHALCFEHVSESIADSWYFFLLSGNLSFFVGVSLFLGKTHQKAMAVLSSLVGGCLLSSSLAYFAMFTAVHFREKINSSTQLEVPDSCPAWINFLEVLTSPTSEPVGLFANSPYNPEVGSGGSSLDRWIGYTLWLAFFVIGIMVQMKKEKKETNAREVLPLQSSSGAEGHLRSPLLLA